jgi:hypothetical protein
MKIKPTNARLREQNRPKTSFKRYEYFMITKIKAKYRQEPIVPDDRDLVAERDSFFIFRRRHRAGAIWPEKDGARQTLIGRLAYRGGEGGVGKRAIVLVSALPREKHQSSGSEKVMSSKCCDTGRSFSRSFPAHGASDGKWTITERVPKKLCGKIQAVFLHLVEFTT